MKLLSYLCTLVIKRKQRTKYGNRIEGPHEEVRGLFKVV